MIPKIMRQSHASPVPVTEKQQGDFDYASDDLSIHSSPAEAALERKLLLKLDLRVLPILWLLFLISFVDRANIGNARIEGLEKSLHMNPKGHDYNIALFSFTIPYVIFEVPSNILLKKLRPAWWLSGLMFCWGAYSVPRTGLDGPTLLKPKNC